MSIQRQVPISMEPARWNLDLSHPLFRESTWPSIREPTRDAAVYQPHWPSGGCLPLSRSFFNPERQLGTMDEEMQRMAHEMKRMFSDMQHLIPADANPESWRIKENFLLDNPLYHDHSSGRQMFRLQFDVRQFKPDEICVKTMGNQMTVHAKHEEKSEGKSLHREYHRQYVLPKGVNPETLVSKLTREGVLTIEAPMAIAESHKEDKVIPIKHE